MMSIGIVIGALPSRRSTTAAFVPMHRSSARMSGLHLDPYEEQYRKYTSAQPPEPDVDPHEMQPSPQTRSGTQQRYMPGGTQQYLQCLSSTIVAGEYQVNDSSLDETEEVSNPNPYESIDTVNQQSSYDDLQYQQYLEDMRNQMLPQDESQLQTLMQDDHVSVTSETESEQLSSEQLKQQEQNTQDVEESFLRTLSNEVNYKKFLNQSPYSLTDINIPVLLQRFLDNLEDNQQKRNGKLKGVNKRLQQYKPRAERKTVVVLGTGWAAHAFVKLASTYDLRIVVVSPVNHFVFTPMLASASVGTVEYRSMTEAIRVTNPCIDNYVEGRAIGVDVQGR